MHIQRDMKIGTYNLYNSISKLIFDIKYKNGWVYTEDNYPRCEENVLVLTDEGTITTAIYEDGTICEEDSNWALGWFRYQW